MALFFSRFSFLLIRLPDGRTLYTIEDSFYQQSRFFSIDTRHFPYTLDSETRITDPDGLIDAVSPKLSVNETDFVSLDLEGITISEAGMYPKQSD